MKDLRKQNKLPIKGHTFAGYTINKDSVKEMLTTMGVNADETMVSDAIGFLSMNSMEFNMNNLYEFLKSRSIMSYKDLRKKK